MNSAGASQCYQIDQLVLDTGRCELRYDNKLVQLPGLSFDLLATLAKHAPNVVSIDELIDEIWQGRLVAEETVTQRVKLLREVLSQHEGCDRLIATVRGRGYRLAAPVVQLDPALIKGKQKKFGTGFSVAALLMVLGASIIWWINSVNTSHIIREKSVAVLPFVNMSDDQETEYFVDGMSEALLSRLARLPGLRVPSRTSSFAFKNTNQDIQHIAKQLAVKSILEGSVRKSKDRIRITVQLIDVDSDSHIWTKDFDRDMDDILAVQDEVAAAIVQAFQLTPQAIPSHHLSSSDTLDTFLRAKQDLRLQTSTSLEDARGGFQSVIEANEEFVPAYVGLAQSLFYLARMANYPMEEADKNAYDALTRALALDDQFAEAHAFLGLLRLVNGDGDSGLISLERALEINGNLANAHLWTGYAYRGRQDFERAGAAFEQALSLDPVNTEILNAISISRMGGGDYDAGIEHFNHRLSIEPGSAETYRLMALFARTFGRLDDAVNWSRKAVELDPGPINRSELVMAYSAIGDFESATVLVEQAYQAAPENHWVVALKAFTQINSGNYKALETFTDDQLQLVPAGVNEHLSQASRIRLALAGLSSIHRSDFAQATQRIERALGDPSKPVLEPQFHINMLGALAYCYRQVGRADESEPLLRLVMDAIGQQKDWMSRHLIYPDTIASIQLIRGDKRGALTTLQTAFDDGWRGYWTLTRGPIWRELADEPDFVDLLQKLKRDVESMRLRVSNPETASVIPLSRLLFP